MTQEDYVSFETAKLLKENGFDEKCLHYYEDNRHCDGDIKFSNWCNIEYSNSEIGRRFTCPTQAMAMKWLREVHNISVRPRYDEVEGEKERIYYAWFFDILSMNPYKTLVEPEQGYPTYEEACEAAIKYCLENLI